MKQNPSQNYTSQEPNSGEAKNPGFLGNDVDEKAILSNGSGEFISLSEASKISDYHPDYLSFLCRSGKLKGFKLGRNWVTTKANLDEFIRNYKNGVSEVVDESGQKIPVHIEPMEAKAIVANVGTTDPLLKKQSGQDP